MKRALAMLLLAGALAAPAGAVTPVETPSLAYAVNAGTLPPVAQRLPLNPSVVRFDGAHTVPGRHGGTLEMVFGRSKDIRLLNVYGYARLVGYDRDYNLVPDILESVEEQDARVFTLRLRPGHRWSDGHPFTAEAFRYWWEDIANNRALSPSGPPRVLYVNGEPPVVSFPDAHTVRFAWERPNPFFLPALAGARPLYIFAPAHYLKRYHQEHAPAAALKALVAAHDKRDWIALHFAMGRMYNLQNPKLPSLQPWVLRTAPPATRFMFSRNPYFHRIDPAGRQLPYIDDVAVQIANSKLIPAKSGAGETDLQARGLSFQNYTFLKQGEKRNDYKVRLWETAKGAHMALYPNLNATDTTWRRLFREADFRRALSLGINRYEINQVIYFGLARQTSNMVLPQSPLYHAPFGQRWTDYDPDRANAMLDRLGLTERDGRGIRLLPDSRPMEIIVETAGESSEQADVLQLVRDSWRKLGIKIHIKPLQREVFRNRIFAGSTLMSVWFGLENGLPTPDTSPRELAATSQQQLQWPKWGQYYETRGQAGAAVDLEPVQKLNTLNAAWRLATSRKARALIWHEMLDIYTDQVFSIGLIAGVPQPVVVNSRLRNVPKKGVYNWDPGAHFGLYRPDTFWFADR